MSIVVAGANVHDTKLLALTLESIVVERPVPTEAEPQRLCPDTKGMTIPRDEKRPGSMAMKPHPAHWGGEVGRIG